MARKQLTEAEKTGQQYAYALKVEGDEFARSAAYDAIAEIGRQLDLDLWNSTVALRDFAQYRLAQIQDERAAERTRKIAELEGKLAK